MYTNYTALAIALLRLNWDLGQGSNLAAFLIGSELVFRRCLDEARFVVRASDIPMHATEGTPKKGQ